jgi:GYF domain 2
VNDVTGQEQWYIAREGKQHGPLSDPEMLKLVELGHLKPADLVWRAGFPDWRPAASVFPSTAPPQAAPAPVVQQAPAPAPFFQTSPVAQQPAIARPVTTERPVTQQPRTALATARPDDLQQLPFGPSPKPVEAPKSGAGRAIAIAAALLVLIAGGAFAAYKNQTAVKTFVASLIPAAKPAKENAAASVEQTAAATATPTAPPPPKLNTDAIDKQFQKTPLWNLLKAEFPEWYDERVQETAQLASENKPESEVIAKIVQALVSLRRQHADKALSASSPKLQEIATAFLGNLKALQLRSVESCYGFISKGETEPSVVELMQKAEESGPIQAQMTAIFSAVVEGRKTPLQHSQPLKGDYDLLATELGTLGWSQADIQLFADPKALAQAPRDRVCKMVQDWFAAHLALKDTAAQERLLFETLRPVVSG